jgi:nitrite reductase/ring-hydroxylating ferredoxin subunit
MVKRRGLAALSLVALAFAVACAPAATAASAGPMSEPAADAIPMPAATAAPDTAQDSKVSQKASASVDAEPLTEGVSSRTTRGHVWAEPAFAGDSVAVLWSVAEMGDHLHFEVPGESGPREFLGYLFEDEFYVRAAVCPNCGAERIEWGGTLLACRACSTTFDRVTGEASEDRRGFPLGTLPYEVEDGAITMSLSELQVAYARTGEGAETLLPVEVVVEDEDRGDRSWPRCCTT